MGGPERAEQLSRAAHQGSRWCVLLCRPAPSDSLRGGLGRNAQCLPDLAIAHPEFAQMLGPRCDLLVEGRRRELEQRDLGRDLPRGSNPLRPRPRALRTLP